MKMFKSLWVHSRQQYVRILWDFVIKSARAVGQHTYASYSGVAVDGTERSPDVWECALYT